MYAKKFISKDGNQYSTCQEQYIEVERACYYKLPTIQYMQCMHRTSQTGTFISMCHKDCHTIHIFSRIRYTGNKCRLYTILCIAEKFGEGGITPVKITPNTFNPITFVEDLFYLCDKNIRCCSFIINMCYKLCQLFISF